MIISIITNHTLRITKHAQSRNQQKRSVIFIGPESDHFLPLSLTHLLTN